VCPRQFDLPLQNGHFDQRNSSQRSSIASRKSRRPLEASARATNYGAANQEISEDKGDSPNKTQPPEIL
jgi:hypothetical protein